MSKPSGLEVASLAETLADGKRIPYVFGHETITSADCQGFIEAVVRKLKGSMGFRGSNDMFRNAVNFVVPIKQAKEQGIMKPGGLLFVVKNDGGEIPWGYKDGLGNAAHVGFYTGLKYFSVHSSSVADDVVGTDETHKGLGLVGSIYPQQKQSEWTHYGEAKAIDYTENSKPVDSVPPVDGSLNNVLLALESALAGLKKFMAGG